MLYHLVSQRANTKFEHEAGEDEPYVYVRSVYLYCYICAYINTHIYTYVPQSDGTEAM